MDISSYRREDGELMLRATRDDGAFTDFYMDAFRDDLRPGERPETRAIDAANRLLNAPHVWTIPSNTQTRADAKGK